MSSIATVTQKRFPEILLLLVNVQYPYQWDRQVQTLEWLILQSLLPLFRRRAGVQRRAVSGGMVGALEAAAQRGGTGRRGAVLPWLTAHG